MLVIFIGCLILLICVISIVGSVDGDGLCVMVNNLFVISVGLLVLFVLGM